MSCLYVIEFVLKCSRLHILKFIYGASLWINIPDAFIEHRVRKNVCSTDKSVCYSYVLLHIHFDILNKNYRSLIQNFIFFYF